MIFPNWSEFKSFILSFSTQPWSACVFFYKGDLIYIWGEFGGKTCEVRINSTTEAVDKTDFEDNYKSLMN